MSSAVAAPRLVSRPRGTGSIQWKKNGKARTYYAVVRVDGKPKWLRAGPTSQDAEALLHQVFAGVVDPREVGRRAAPAPVPLTLVQPLPEPDEEWTLETFAEAWMDDLDDRPLKEETRCEYKRIVQNVLIPCLGPKLLSDVEAADAYQLVLHRMKGTAPVLAGQVRPDGKRIKVAQRVSLERALRELAVLRTMFTDAVDRGEVHANPCAGLTRQLRRRFKHEGRIRVVLDDADVARLLAATPHEHRLLMTLLVRAGLRLGEALALRARCFHAPSRTLRIDQTWSHSRIGPPKSMAGNRSLRLSEGVATLVVAHCSEALAMPDNPDGWLFPGALRSGCAKRMPLDPGHWRRTVFHPAAAAAGLPGHTVPHSLRHTAAVAWLRGRGDVRQPEATVPAYSRARVQALLGHSSAASTEWYTQMVPQDWPGVDVFD